MPDYRCFLINGGHIVASQDLVATEDGAAIAEGHGVFERRKGHCSGFEVWERDRVVHRHDGA